MQGDGDHQGVVSECDDKPKPCLVGSLQANALYVGAVAGPSLARPGYRLRLTHLLLPFRHVACDAQDHEALDRRRPPLQAKCLGGVA